MKIEMIRTRSRSLQNSRIALRRRSENIICHQENTHVGRTNKARFYKAVCSKAIVKREYLVFFSRLDGYNQTLLLGGSVTVIYATSGLNVRPRDVTSAQRY